MIPFSPSVLFGWQKTMNTKLIPSAFVLAALGCSACSIQAADNSPAPIRHSYLVLGGHTAIIGEEGQAAWEYDGGSRDGFVLPNGNVLIAYSDRVVEVTRDKQAVFSYQRSKENSEIGTTQRLYDGNTLVTELGRRPRLLEVDPKANIVLDVPLQPETENAHFQTRMARQLKNGNFLVPHLLAFAVKE